MKRKQFEAGKMKKSILFLAVFLSASIHPVHATILECISPNGEKNYTDNSKCPEGYQVGSTYKQSEVKQESTAATPTWKSELDSICNDSKNASNLSDMDIEKLIDKTDLLRPVISAASIDPSYKYTCLSLAKNCRDLFVLERDNRRRQVNYDRMVRELQNKAAR